ncbi:MAG: response regulator transcription factor [Gammaproteobacteria bacterium]|nr:response regulator transcription factor [Gammaproteobacteria bacterium]
MRILIADDEPLARARLASLVAEIGPPWELVAELADGEAVLRRCGEGDIDLVLLDIRMPGLDGISAAARLQQLETPPVVIFTTAYSERALDAFDQQASDYLLKPIRKERLQKSLDRALGLSRVQRQSLQLAPLPVLPVLEDAVCVRLRGELLRIELADIYFFRAEDKYVVVRHRGGEALLEDSLKVLEQRFGQGFLRIHRNALVNLAFLAGLKKDRAGHPCALLKECDQCLEVSRRLLPNVRQWLKGA